MLHDASMPWQKLPTSKIAVSSTGINRVAKQAVNVNSHGLLVAEPAGSMVSYGKSNWLPKISISGWPMDKLDLEINMHVIELDR